MIAALLEEVASRHGLLAGDGIQVLALDVVPHRAFDPSWPLVLLPAEPRSPGGASSVPNPGGGAPGDPRDDFEPAALPGRGAHAEPLALLRSLYPADHPVLGLGGAPDRTLAEVDPEILASAPHLLPPVAPVDNLGSPYGLPWIVARLRAPGGCPWDREQTHESLRPFLLEEAYEVYDALEHGGTPELAGELGDLLLQVVLHAEHAAEEGIFDLQDVYRSIAAKIVRRHPHVFGDVRAGTVGQVLRNWEAIKAAERAASATGGDVSDEAISRAVSATDAAPAAPAQPVPDMPAAFAGLSKTLPALAYAQEMGIRAAALGYDWPDIESIIDKVEEEAVELLEAGTAEERREEFGDLLGVIVNLGRKLGLDAESALRAGNAKFARRFALVERMAAEDGRTLDRMTFDELDDLWNRAKSREREAGAGAARDPGAGGGRREEPT